MNDAELDKLLKSARIPERPPEHWEDFPKTVTTQLRRPPAGSRRRESSPAGLFVRGLGWSFTAAGAVCLLALSLWSHHSSVSATRQFAVAEKCFQEISAMFPHQVSAIILNARGSRIELADLADLPDSPPIFLRICGPGGCQTIITFSGQRVRIGNEDCDVLAGNAGNVILAGDSAVWTSDNPSHSFSQFHITAKTLNPNS